MHSARSEKLVLIEINLSLATALPAIGGGVGVTFFVVVLVLTGSIVGVSCRRSKFAARGKPEYACVDRLHGRSVVQWIVEWQKLLNKTSRHFQ